MPRSAGLLLGASVLVLLLPRPSVAQDVPRFYEENCSGCHTIGGGAQAGPDLKGVTTRVDRPWLIRFMLDPEAVVNSGDPRALKILKEWDDSLMPATEGMTPALAEALLRYIDDRSGAAAVADDAGVTEGPPAADRIEAGKQFFIGSRPLVSGGPACLGCHRANGLQGWNGGRVGPDLTGAHERLGGRRAAAAWLANPPTPMMRAVYRNAALDAGEREAFASFFAASATAPAGSSSRSAVAQFAASGVAGAVFIAGGFAFAWRRRFRGVRQRFVEAARRPAPGDQ